MKNLICIIILLFLAGIALAERVELDNSKGLLTLTSGTTPTANGQIGYYNNKFQFYQNGAASELGSSSAPTDLDLDDGSAASPSLSFSSDTDTGLYRIGSGNLGLSLNGTKRFDISSLGILTLTQTETASSNDQMLRMDLNSGYTEFRNLSSENGNMSPALRFLSVDTGGGSDGAWIDSAISPAADSGTRAVLGVLAYQSDDTVIEARPLFGVYNNDRDNPSLLLTFDGSLGLTGNIYDIGDTNTGITFLGSDSIAITAGGSDVLTINGTTSTLTSALRVNSIRGATNTDTGFDVDASNDYAKLTLGSDNIRFRVNGSDPQISTNNGAFSDIGSSGGGGGGSSSTGRESFGSIEIYCSADTTINVTVTDCVLADDSYNTTQTGNFVLIGDSSNVTTADASAFATNTWYCGYIVDSNSPKLRWSTSATAPTGYDDYLFVTCAYNKTGGLTADFREYFQVNDKVRYLENNSDSALYLTGGTATSLTAISSFTGVTWPTSINGVRRAMAGIINCSVQRTGGSGHTSLIVAPHGFGAATIYLHGTVVGAFNSVTEDIYLVPGSSTVDYSVESNTSAEVYAQGFRLIMGRLE